MVTFVIVFSTSKNETDLFLRVNPLIISFDQYIVFLVPDSCRATPRNLQYKRGRLKRLERCSFLIYLDNLVFFCLTFPPFPTTLYPSPFPPLTLPTYPPFTFPPFPTTLCPFPTLTLSHHPLPFPLSHSQPFLLYHTSLFSHHP